MNVVKCKNGHFFDKDKYGEYPHCGAESAVNQSKNTADDKNYRVLTKKANIFFNIVLPDYEDNTTAYCCIMHHPLRSSCITPYHYPVDRLYVLYNGVLKKIFQYEENIYNLSVEIHKLNDIDDLSDGKNINIQANWDRIVKYHFDICDAMESWDFVFSKSPIDIDSLLNEYEYQSRNVYARKTDLIESNKRKNPFF